MGNYQITDQIEKNVLSAWEKCVNDEQNEIYIDELLEKYLGEDDSVFLNTSWILLFRFFQKRLKGIINLDGDNSDENAKKLAELLANESEIGFCKICDGSDQWYNWLTKGFTLKQRLYLFKIAICGQMEEEDFFKLLAVVDGENVNTKNPTDVIYYYAYKRSYTLAQANEINRKYNIKYNSLRSKKSYENPGEDKAFFDDIVVDFGKKNFIRMFYKFLEGKEADEEIEFDDKVKNIENSSKDFLWSFLSDLFANSISEMSDEEEMEYFVDKISADCCDVCSPPPVDYKKTIRKWLSTGIKKKKEAFRLGLSLKEMKYDEYLSLLRSVDGREYDFTNEEYCVYYYCKKKGYELKKADNILQELFYRYNSIGLTQHFDVFFTNNLDDDTADQLLIEDLIQLSDKMNSASIHNIARFARLSQYVVKQYDGSKDVKVKMNYNYMFPQGAQLYKAIYGEPMNDYIDGQKTHSKGEGVFYDFVAKYFKDYGSRLKDKYDILMGKRRIDLRYHSVKRMEVLSLLYPFVLCSDKHITKSDLTPFKCNDDRTDKKEWECEIQKTWDEFDLVIEEAQEYLETIVKPLAERAKKIRRSDSQLFEVLKELLKAYERVFNIVLKEFGFVDIYLPYLGDRFFILNILTKGTFDCDNNLARGAMNFAGWDPDWNSPRDYDKGSYWY